MSEEEHALTKIGALEPVYEKPELVQQNIKKFREACKAILDPKVDISIISGKPFIRKSGWNVLNQYFGVQTIPIKSWRTELENGEYMITVVIQTSLKNFLGPARSASCTSMEMKAKHHNKEYLGMDSHCYGMAETRAVGRASAAWYMVGDTSAEEMEPMNNIKGNTTDDNKPTEKQLEYLKNLGYTGPRPDTKEMASNIIEDLKNGAVPAKTVKEEKKDDDIDYCKCEKPQPKFEKDSKTNKNHCYQCNKPVTDKQAEKLLTGEK